MKNTPERTFVLAAGAAAVLATVTVTGDAQSASASGGTLAWGSTTTTASVSSTGGEANRHSLRSPAISARGRYVAFTSTASNLVPDDTNGAADVFVRDRRGGVTERASVGAHGEQASEDGASAPAISGDGRLVTFQSEATNLVPGDTNGEADVFIRDIRRGTTRKVSVALNGAPAHGPSWSPAISGDGRYVAFVSSADNLVGGDTNDHDDVFIRDLRKNVTRRVSVTADGTQADGDSSSPALSRNGRTIAFVTGASNLVPDDHNSDVDVVVKDLATGQLAPASVAVAGASGNGMSTGPALSADGRVVAFTSSATDLVSDDTNEQSDVFVRDLHAGTTSRISVAANGAQADASSSKPTVSATGKLVAFTSYATNICAGDTNGTPDVFVRDLRAASAQVASVALSDAPGDGGSDQPVLSADGAHLAFLSHADNLVQGDTNGVQDVVVRDASSDPRTVKG